MGLRYEGGIWGTSFRLSFGKVSDRSPKSITLSPEEETIYNNLIQDNGQTVSWTLLEEFSLINVGLSTILAKGIFLHFYFQCSSRLAFLYSSVSILIAFHCFSAIAAINAVTMPVVEETTRMKKARLVGLERRGKPTDPIFLRKHKEPVGECSTEAPPESSPVTFGSFHPA